MYKKLYNVKELDKQEAIAIIGAGFKGPGAENLEELWEVLKDGQNHIVDLPKDRWNVDAFYDSDPQALGKYYTKKAGLMANPLDFDNAFFNINDIESDQMDPQQKHVLECTYRAMEHAGLTRNMLKESKTGVYIGAMNCDYRGLFPVGYSVVSNYTVTGVSNSIIAARVSFAFDLRGPCMVMDTGCSSALIAIHIASHGLLHGDCTLAICGGTNFIASPDNFIHLSKAQMVSPTGQCHAFSELADGYTRGEGCGIIILKKLCDAERDQDRILAIIKTATNQDGHDVTPISAPSKTQQIRLLEDVYRTMSLEQLDEVEYIEAHGTGTQAGDFAEAHALGEFFIKRGSSKKRLMGSIKTNMGHLEAAAGVAGLIKLLLMMEHSMIVPSLFSDKLNKRIDFDKLNLTVVSKPREWTSKKKVGSVNSFGFGGSNCHAIITHVAKNLHKTKALDEEKQCIVCFSGKNEASLIGSMKDLTEYKKLTSLNLHDISYTSTRRRSHYKVRRALVADGLEDLVSKVNLTMQSGATVTQFRELSIVFVFGGMGTSWNDMCKELLIKSLEFRNVLNNIDHCLQKYVKWSMVEILSQGKDINDPLMSPLAMFACQVGLAKLWLSLGVKPSKIVGQSVGEVAAAYISDHLSLQDAVKVIYTRSLLLSKVVGGKMFIIRNMSIEIVKNVVSCYHGKANVSVEYSPLSCAVSSDPDIAENIKNHLMKIAKENYLNIILNDLKVPTAYHSHHMDSIKLKLGNELVTINPKESSTFSMISSVTGKKLETPLGADYWMDNLREPVKFFDAVRNTYSDNTLSIYIEIGPQPVLWAHMQDIFKENNVECFPSMKKNVVWRQFLDSVAAIYNLGVDIDWAHLPQYGHQVTPVPRYCFHTRKGFYKSEQAYLALSGVDCLKHTHPYVYKINNTEVMIMISEVTFPSVYEHKVSNMLVIPGAFYAEAGFAITKFHQDMKAPMYTVSVQFKQPYRLPREGATVLKVECFRITPNTYKIDIKNEVDTFAILELSALKEKLDCPKENIQFLKGRCSRQIKKEEIYSILKQYGFTYGPKFSLLQSAYSSENDCIAMIIIPESLTQELQGTTIHPSIIDCMMHSSAILELGSEKIQELLPQTIGKLTSFRDVEKNMYVVTSRKGREDGLTFYDIKLTTLEGQIIAYIENFSNKILSKKADSLDAIYDVVWTEMETVYPNLKTQQNRALFITDFVPATTPYHIQDYCHQFDILKQPWEVFNGNLPNLNSSFDFIVVLVMNCSISDSEDGDLVLEKSLNLCLFLQKLYNCALNQRFQKPIFVFTKGAFALNSNRDSDANNNNALIHGVNPIMTSLWGMFRCAIYESIHDLVFAVELNISKDDINLDSLASIAELINNDTTLKSYAEFLVTDKHLYVNHIVKLDRDTRIPNFRLNHTDENTNFLVLNSHPSILDKTCCVYQDNAHAREITNSVEISLSEAAIQNPELYHLNRPLKDWKRRLNEDGFLMFALESRGNIVIDGNENLNVVACFPVPLASKVEVPKEVIIETAILNQYIPGDFTKITLLMALCLKVKLKSVTILASKTTFHLAKCLTIMLKTFDSLTKINILQVEHFNKTNKLEETVMSLVLVDQRIISAIESLTEKPKQFITVYKLLKDAFTFFSVTFPDISLDLLDTKALFSPKQLIMLVPQVKKWVKNHSTEAKSMLDLIHDQNLKFTWLEEKARDLRSLLECQNFKMTHDHVRAGKLELFRKDSVYIVVAGLTGLGLLTVKYLAENGSGCIAIINRRTADPNTMSTISSLSLKTNCLIEVLSGDVSDFVGLKALFSSINQRFPNKVIRGIFFGAAVLEDRPLLEMSKQDFIKVLLPKVKGAWNLHLITRDMSLDYFVLYSSITSIVGNFTQSNYGAGNAFMDGLAFYRRSVNLAAQSFNWGALNLGILEGKDEIKKRLEARGFMIMSEEEIVQYMQPLLFLNWTQLIPCIFKNDMNEESIAKGPDRVRKRMVYIFNYQYQKEEVHFQEDKLNMARDLPPEQRLPLYEEYIKDLASQVLNLPKETLKHDSNLMHYGLDSIVAMTMITYIYRHVGCRLQYFQFLSGQSSVQDIAKYIDEALSSEELKGKG